MSRKYNTRIVPANTLKVGDVILAHGGLFRVFKVVVSQAHDNSGPGGACHANYCEFLGNAYEGEECAIPKHWRDGSAASPGRPELDNFWNHQGNAFHRTALVIEE